jgi:hypothetical protein
MNQDLEHLRLLSIFHYVVSGLAALFACFPVIHLIIGLVLVFAPDNMTSNGDVPPALIGWFFVIFAVCFILAGLTLAVFIAITGRFLSSISDMFSVPWSRPSNASSFRSGPSWESLRLLC